MSLRQGFLGVGFMGQGMCRNILAKQTKGSVLTVFDVNADNVAKLGSHPAGGLTVAANVAEVTRGSSVIALSLPSQEVQEKVLFGPAGVVETYLQQAKAQQPLTIVDHGTFSHAFALEAHARLRQHAIRYIDAPVSGGPGGAAAGTLTIMAGCTPAELEAVRPLLACYSSSGAGISCFGLPGAGMAAKIVNQALVGMHAQAACEALALAEKMGITDMELLNRLLAASWGQSRIQGIVFDDYVAARKGQWGSLDRPSPAPLRNLDKDFGCVLAAAGPGLPLPLAQATQRSIQTACETGRKDGPFVGLIESLRPRPQ